MDYPIHQFFETEDNPAARGQHIVNSNALEKLEEVYQKLLETKEALLKTREAEIEWLHKLLIHSGSLATSDNGYKPGNDNTTI